MLEKISSFVPTRKTVSRREAPKQATWVDALKAGAVFMLATAARAQGGAVPTTGLASGLALPDTGTRSVALRDVPWDATPANLASLPAATSVAWGSAPRFISGLQFATACVEGAHAGQTDRYSVGAFINDIDSPVLADATEACIDSLQNAAQDDGCVTRDGLAFTDDCLELATTFFPDEHVDPLHGWNGGARAPAPAPGGAPALAPESAPVGAPAPQ